MQILFILVDIVTVVVIEYAFFKVYDMAFGLRSKPEDELAGLDITEAGCPAYPNFAIHDSPGSYSDTTPVSGSVGSVVSTVPSSVNG